MFLKPPLTTVKIAYYLYFLFYFNHIKRFLQLRIMPSCFHEYDLMGFLSIYFILFYLFILFILFILWVSCNLQSTGFLLAK